MNTNPTVKELAAHDPVLAYNVHRLTIERIKAQKRQGGAVAARPPSGDGTVGREDATLPYIDPTLLGWGEPSCGWGWQILNLTGTWTSGAADQSVQGQLNGIVTADLWVRKVTYTMQRPNAFVGSIFKAQSDENFKRNPLTNFELTIQSYCQYIISDTPTPLENIEATFECVCPVGFVLGCSTQMTSRYTNLWTFDDEDVPINAVISFHGVRLPTRYDNCGVNHAVAELLEAGLI